VLDEFYKNLKAVGVSSVTGDGVKEFFEAVDASREEYEREYLPELERAKKQREKTLQDIKDDSVNRLLKDLAVDRTKNPRGPLNDRWDPEEEEEDDDTEISIVDKSDERYPGEYIDMTRGRRHEDENINWPRPG